MGKRERGYFLSRSAMVSDFGAVGRSRMTPRGRREKEGESLLSLEEEGKEEISSAFMQELMRRVERGVVLHGEGQAGLALGGGELFAGGVKAKLGRWGFVTGKRR